MQRAKRMPSYKRWVVAAVLVLVSWNAYRGRRPASTLGASPVQGSNAIGQQLPSVSANFAEASAVFFNCENRLPVLGSTATTGSLSTSLCSNCGSILKLGGTPYVSSSVASFVVH